MWVTSEKCPYSQFFWSMFSRILIEYGPENLRIRTLFTKCKTGFYFYENVLIFTHFVPPVSFYTHCKHQVNSGFLIFVGDIERDQRHKMFNQEYCVKTVCIRSCSGPYFSVSRLNTERYGVSLRIQCECRKIPTRKTPNTDAFHTVEQFNSSSELCCLFGKVQ